MKHLRLLFILFVFFGCKQDIEEPGNHIIDIDLDNLSDDSLPDLTITSVVPLETNEAALFGNPDIVEWEDGYIFILDRHKSRALYAFKEDGTFLGKTKQGKGPGEMINPFALYLDMEANQVFVWDQGAMSTLQYDFNLEYHGQEAFRNPLTNFALLENDRTLVQSSYYKDFSYKIFGPDKETVEHEFIPEFKYKGSVGLFRSISIKERMLLIAPFHYDIYELEGSELQSRYYVDFGKYKLTQEDVEQKGMSECFVLVSEGQRVSSLNDISEGDSFLSFRVYFKSEPLNFAYSFKDEKPILINHYFEKNLLPVCIVRGIKDHDVFYALVEPSALEDFQKATGKILMETDMNPETALADESNPYLITFTLGE